MDIVQAIIELGFPTGVAVYLLWMQTRQIDRFVKAQNEVKLGLYLILNKLDLIEEYEQAVQNAKISEKKE